MPHTLMSRQAFWPVVCSIILFALAAPRLDAKDEVAPLDRSLLKGIDLEGQLHHFGESDNCRGVVVVFLSTHCPVSNGTLPTLKKLATQHKRSGIEFYGVISSPGTTRAVAIAHQKEYELNFPVLFDVSSDLRTLLEPTHTPQAIVISADRRIVYTGRIDNRFAEIGRRRTAASVHDLKNAIDSVIKGDHIAVRHVAPVGCLLEDLPAANVESTTTFQRDVAPIIYANCSECHREGEAAPFSLQSYSDVCQHAQQIVAVTESRFMPPWHPVEGFGHFQNERRLTANEIDLIKNWVQDGMAEGDVADAPPEPTYPSGWRLGLPDLVLSMQDAFKIEADGPDIHQHFVMPTNMTRNRLVSAVEFHPGNRRVVHHACFYVDTTGAGRELDARAPDVGYGSFVGPGFFNIGALRSWLPGMSPLHLPDGTGQPMNANSDLILEIHYQRSGKAESDQSEVGIYFAKPSAKTLVCEIQVMNKTLEIPAGDANYKHTASYTLPVDVELLDAAPHMHLLGKEMKATATLPDGSIRPLIWIKDWDFNWQGQYLYADPVALPRGTRIDVEAYYDNSADNPLNPNSPPQQVTWSEQTTDEMGICHFRYVCKSPDALLKMNLNYLNYVTDQQQKYEQMLRRTKSSRQ